jgi:peptide/nickel transport system substrate-binding protein
MSTTPRGRAHLNRANRASGMTRRDLLAASALGLVAGAPRLAHAAAPSGQLTWALHVSVPSTWFDPADTPGIISPFMILYALHDAMVKPMPGNPQAPSLARIVDHVGGQPHL